MRQKRSKELRQLAFEISHDYSVSTFPSRRWAPKSVPNIYRSMKRELKRMPWTKRHLVGDILNRVEIVD